MVISTRPTTEDFARYDNNKMQRKLLGLAYKRIGLGRGVQTTVGMQQLLRKGIESHPKDTQMWKSFAALLKKGRGIYFIDTDNVHNVMTEISVIDAAGTVILDTKVNHGMSINDIYRRSESAAIPRFFCTIRKAYGPPTTGQTLGLTAKENSALLAEKGLNQDLVLVEWSTSRCD